MTSNSRNSSSRSRARRGAAAVEFAVAAPLLFLFFFSALEFGRMHMVRHTIQNASYEAARRGVSMGVDEEAIEERYGVELDLTGEAGRSAVNGSENCSSTAPPSSVVRIVITRSNDANT